VRVDRTNFEQAQRHLEECGIPWKLWDRKICHALYFFDPDGNQIEVTTFELGAPQT
jgi:catechol-2,3-dioxygenase